MRLPESTKFRVRDQRKPNHHWADNEVIDVYGPRIGMIGYAIYMYLCRHAWSGRCVKKQSDIATAFNCDPGRVRRHIGKLQDAGLIAIEEGGLGETHSYLILQVAKAERQNAARPSGETQPIGTAKCSTTNGKTQYGEQQNAAPNKEARLSQDFSQDLRGRERPLSPSVLLIARENFWKIYDGLERNPEKSWHADAMDRLRISAVRPGLPLAQTQAMLREHPRWQTWKFLD